MAEIGDHQAGNGPERHHTRESPEYRLLVIGLFPLFLAATVLVRVLTLGRGRLVARDRARQSVFAEARAVADTILPWAFSKG
jgi:sensor domain CHASE-containing protein